MAGAGTGVARVGARLMGDDVSRRDRVCHGISSLPVGCVTMSTITAVNVWPCD